MGGFITETKGVLGAPRKLIKKGAVNAVKYS
jgi:hypothetical protein